MHDVCVVGLGYVGLPTASALALAGLSTIGVDARHEVVEKVTRGESHLTEAGLGEAVGAAVKSGRLQATGDLAKAVRGSRAVIVAVQTPYEGGRVVLDHLKGAIAQVSAAIRPGAVVILESTVPPGTCRKTVLPMLESGGKKDGRDFYFAYCPERMAPGNSLSEFTDNDRLIGAANDESLERAERVMKKAVKGSLVRAELTHAEVAKLVENTARDVYIAFANDLAKMSMSLAVDAREVIRLANTHPRVRILSPGPGVGGPCLTKDPYLLLEGLGGDDGGLGVMVRAARKVNDGMYKEVVALFERGGAPPRGSKVAVFGTSYKPQVGDPRGSPSKPLVEYLARRGYDVWAFDPYCVEGFGARMAPSAKDAAEGASCIVVMVAHKEFLGLDYSALASSMSQDPRIVDSVGVAVLDRKSPAYTLRRLGDGTNPQTESTRGKA